MSATLRGFHPIDLPGIYRVCRHVDGAGRLAPLPYDNDDLLGHLYAGPYIAADPSLAFVLVDAEGVGGYIVGTADVEHMRLWADMCWWPPLRQQYSLNASPPRSSADQAAIAVLHEGFSVTDERLSNYPAQLHMKLEPRLQGRGWGGALMARCIAELRRRRVSGVHVSVAEQNEQAIGFYRRCGFTEVLRLSWGRSLALTLE